MRLEQRYWLPEFNGDLGNELGLLKENLSSGQQVYEDLRALANHDLNQKQLNKIGSFIKRNRTDIEGQGFENFSLGVVSNGSMKFLHDLLVGIAAGYGLLLQIRYSDFDQAFALASNAGEPFFEENYDAILLAGFEEGLRFPEDGFHNAEETETLLQLLSGRLQSEVTGIKENAGCPIFLQNYVPPQSRLFGNNDAHITGSRTNLVNRLNDTVRNICVSGDATYVDIAQTAAGIGLANWSNARNWNLAKLPFSDAAMVPYCNMIAGSLAAQKGKTRRALILDLDNTLWGGVIGDDGIDGIVLGEGSPDGEAHKKVQEIALALSRRGIVLSICSKNTESIAREPFQKHPEMVLREKDIAVFVANWQDKASNIRSIAENLSLGLDSFVFLDDNPAERELVRKELPLVMVPELGTDASKYPATLLDGNFFELPELSQADRERSGQYIANAERHKLKATTTDMGAYHTSLEMVAAFKKFAPEDLKRITQLIGKSNQFNLTTKRYTEVEIQDILNERNSKRGFSVRLKDKFGDNGIVSVVILDFLPSQTADAPAYAMIDTWLMSCRVLGRRLEEFIVNEITDFAKRNKAEKLIGLYKETTRNGMVSDLYEKMGFEAHSEEGQFILATESFSPLDTKIRAET